METTEKIIESYCRYVKQWFTIRNIWREGQRNEKFQTNNRNGSGR
jgi:hypothetical protein